MRTGGRREGWWVRALRSELFGTCGWEKGISGKRKARVVVGGREWIEIRGGGTR